MSGDKEDVVECAKCGSDIPAGDALYDENTLRYLCDVECAYEWADANFEYVAEEYVRRNIR